MTPPVIFHLAEKLDAPVTVERFHAAFPARGRSTFVLSGGGNDPRLDRFAFMGAEPVGTLRARRVDARDGLGRALTDVVIEHGGVRTLREGVDPFGALDAYLSAHAVEEGDFDARYPFPFRAGLVGYIGYECGQTLERLPRVPRPSVGMPDMAFSLHSWVIATNHETAESWLSVVGFGRTRAEAREHAEAVRARVVLRLGSGARGDEPASSRASVAARDRRPDASTMTTVTKEVTPAEYMRRVAIAKDHIRTGDTFEICLTAAQKTPLSSRLVWPLFDELRRSNPAPFAALLDLPEGAIVSSSPERFLSRSARGVVESRPIKGTRPRGTTPENDAQIARELASSEKDRAENAMIVDLVRNDFGRVCRFGTVDVPELFAVERYATVHQLVSTVRGELAPGIGAGELLRATFPPGSMTGAPKIEAMSILEHLEPSERGVYSGALGWIDLGGALDLSVVIRTIVVTSGLATFSVGGAIVDDSDPRAEYEEAEQKARALTRALDVVSRQTKGGPRLCLNPLPARLP